MEKVPFSRWDVDAKIAHNPHLSGKIERCMSWGSFVKDLELFDAAFFTGMLSESGRCHTFDSAADGFVHDEGCGAVVLKRMEVVSLERNQVHAVIRSVDVAQDGKSTSLMAPNGMACGARP